jgi:hypothetical protein
MTASTIRIDKVPGHQEKDQYKENPTPAAGVVSSKKSPPAGLMLTLVHTIGYVNYFFLPPYI